MALFSADDINVLSKNMDNILEEVEKKTGSIFEPTLDERKNVTKEILDFVKKNKRKIYGGFALNAMVKDKQSKDAIYKDHDTPDIDFYSPEPIKDLMALCNQLHEKKFKYVVGKEAMHKETYSIFVNYQLYCDISYTPRNIFNKMPFKEINGIHYIHPHFMAIDYLRMITDPLNSYWRIEKAMKRFSLLQKHYPLPETIEPIKIEGGSKSLESASQFIYEFLKDKPSCISIGFYAYNYYLNESGYLESKKNKNIKIMNVPIHDIISTNYRSDARELISELKKEFAGSKIKTVEHYPFYQFTGFFVEIYMDDDLIARVFHHNNRCSPFFDVPAMKIENGEIKKDKGKIRIGTVATVLMYTLVSVMMYRTLDDKNTRDLYYTVCAHILEYRSFFLKENKKNTIVDNTLFKDFVVECFGETITPEREKRLIIEERKKKNRKFVFTYEPANDVKDPSSSSFIFSNSSGNPINKSRNMKLNEDEPIEDIEGISSEPEEN